LKFTCISDMIGSAIREAEAVILGLWPVLLELRARLLQQERCAESIPCKC
jgi:hypothetical protein